MIEVPISDSTAIVSVDQVLLAPPDLDDPLGTLITLVLAKPGSGQRGEKAVFFTTVHLLGNGLALREVGRLDPKEADGLPNGIADAGRLRADKDLLARIAAADLIVTGKVLETKEVDQNFWPSEHHPDWWQASIEVGSVLKGKFDKNPLLLNFPASDEEGWADSPKFGGGEAGIWIIRRNQMEIGWPAFATPGFSALNPLDFQAPDQIDRVKGLTPCAR